MARPNLRWRDLWPGLAAATLLIVGAVAVLLFARVGALRGETFGLHVVAGSVSDVTAGTDVWLVGQRVGMVRRITFRPPSTDTTRRLLLELEVLERARPLLRQNSEVTFRSGGSLLGATVVALTAGTPDVPPVRPGDTLVARPAPDLQDFAATFAELGPQLPALQRDVQAITGHLARAGGTVGAFRAEGLGGVGDLQRSLGSLTQALSGGGRGSAGQLLGDEALRRRAGLAASQVDSLRLLLASDAGSLGRFRRDSTLPRLVAEVRDELSIVRALLADPSGTVGRARADGIIEAQLRALERELTALLREMKANPLRFIVF